MKFSGKIYPNKINEKYHYVEIKKYGNEGEFIVTAQEVKPLISRFLELRREKAGITIAEVVKKLGKKSLNYYSQYERVKSMPGFDKLREFKLTNH